MTNKMLLLFIFFGLILMLSFKRDKTRKIVFFGDSITQAGVAPNGYITMMKNMLNQQDNSTSYDLIGAGVNGDKVYDLYLRLEEDVLSKSPDIVVIYIGLNDVWHKAGARTGTDPDKFDKFYRAIIKKLLADRAKLILVTPATLGEKKNNVNPQDRDLNQYSDIIKSIGSEFTIPVVDVRTLFQSYEQEHNTNDIDRGILTLDGAHLNDAGNKLVAENILNAIKDLK